jgi:Mg-chelatase subunit ChlI
VGEGEAPALAGRTSERARLAEALGLVDDDLRAVVIAGEPGTGKTALLAEFVRNGAGP